MYIRYLLYDQIINLTSLIQEEKSKSCVGKSGGKLVETCFMDL